MTTQVSKVAKKFEEDWKTLKVELTFIDRKTVMCSGSYDLFHAGHADFLERASAFGEILIVAVNRDASIGRYKSYLRPFINEFYRIAVVSAIGCVDHVLLLEDDDPCKLIEALQPDVYVNGTEWQGKDPEKAIVESYGGQTVYLDKLLPVSTTDIEKRIKKVSDSSPE